MRDRVELILLRLVWINEFAEQSEADSSNLCLDKRIFSFELRMNPRGTFFQCNGSFIAGMNPRFPFFLMQWVVYRKDESSTNIFSDAMGRSREDEYPTNIVSMHTVVHPQGEYPV